MAGSLKTLIALAALTGVAGCAYQEQLPDPYAMYGSRSGGGSYSPYFVYGGSGLYSPYYGYGATDPYFYYRRAYPAYGYYTYPRNPAYYCLDANRDGRCDGTQPDHDDNDHGGDQDHSGDHNGRGIGDTVGGSGRNRDDRLVPRTPRPVVPDSRATERQVPRANSSSRPSAAGTVPHTVPLTPSRTLPSTPKQPPAAARGSPRSDDPAPPSPRLRQVDRR